MIDSKDIEESLSYLKERYDSVRDEEASAPEAKMYYSKLAILEFSGWIEMSVKGIIRETGERIIRDKKGHKMLERKIKRTNGYKHDHFMDLVVTLFGVSGYEKMQKILDNQGMFYGRDSIFWSQMGKLYSLRSELAHSYIKPKTSHSAPSIVTENFTLIKDGLIAYNKAISELK